MIKTKRIKRNWGEEDIKILLWIVSKYCDWKAYNNIEKQLVILFFILLQVNNKNRHLSLYFIYYGVIRFIMEFFRFDDRGTIPFSNLSPAQLISLLLIVSGLSIHFFYKRNLNLA